MIARVDAGESFVDIGGNSEVQEVYWMAKSRLAELHAMDQVEPVDVDFILESAGVDRHPGRAAWLRNRGFEHRLRKSAVTAKPAAWANWLSVLPLLGWELACEPTPLTLGPNTGDSRLLKFKRNQGAPLALAVVDLAEVESNDGVYRLRRLANDLQAEHDGPSIAIGSKGLFVSISAPEGDRSYTVCVSCSDDQTLELVPIWPGATADDVAAQMERKENKFDQHNTDNGNTIAILVNALGSGREIDGDDFPTAIYVTVGSVFNTPVFTVEQAIELGSQSSRADLAMAIKGVEGHFQAQAQRKRQYLGMDSSAPRS